LTAKLLYFYGYNQDNYSDYFKHQKLLVQPIYLVEYIIIRGILFYNLDQVINMNNTFFVDNICLFATNNNLNKIIQKLIKSPGDDYMNILGHFMHCVENNNDLSMCYICLDPMY
jgi:hypothetical protein